jgi:uncharacterized lipoprotein YmbA
MTINRYLAFAVATLLSACGGGNPADASKAAVTKEAKGETITLKSVSVAKDVGPSGLVPSAPPGAIYVVAEYDLKNTGDDALSMDKWPQPLLVDPKGHRLARELFSSTVLSASANQGWAENLNPNLTTTASAVWKVDEKTFDVNKWKLAFGSRPQLVFDLK